MAKLDRLDWAAGMAFRSYGVTIGVRVLDPGILDRVAERLPPGWKQIASPIVNYLYSYCSAGESLRPGIRAFHLVYRGTDRMIRTLDSREALDTLESALHFNVAAASPERLFVHAGVVGWKGRALVIAGRTLSGKTSLVKALIQAGATYYSDEYAVFDTRGRVHPYARPLCVRSAAGGKGESVPAETLGARVGHRPLPVGMIVSAAFRPVQHHRLHSMTPGEMAMVLMDNTLMARYLPEKALRIFSLVTPHTVTLGGVRGEADQAARYLIWKMDRMYRSGRGK